MQIIAGMFKMVNSLIHPFSEGLTGFKIPVRLTTELSRLRVGETRYFIKQLRQQSAVENPSGSKSATANC